MSTFHVGLGVDSLTLYSFSQDSVSSANRTIRVAPFSLVFTGRQFFPKTTTHGELAIGSLGLHGRILKNAVLKKKCDAILFGDEKVSEKSQRCVVSKLISVTLLFRLWCYYLQLFCNII